ncbi:hypothetical protein PCANC_18757 [Puccinia coronata f. sp. avenae]|uniref:Uncharacterized protein n=1 Tax=Puccinia coronata f. sp. avenae TaxID=200324 RepID=A0A2N5UED2_9BASI|nr:hypothetical protein PCANC_18757 [Puccinia coronata f. sp. avenae]
MVYRIGRNDRLGLPMGPAATLRPCRSGVVGYRGRDDLNARSGRAPELVVRPLSGWNAQGVYSELSESSRRVGMCLKLHGGTIPKSGGRRQSYRRPPVALMTATSGIEVIATPVAYNTTPARSQGRCRPHRQP